MNSSAWCWIAFWAMCAVCFGTDNLADGYVRGQQAHACTQAEVRK